MKIAPSAYNIPRKVLPGDPSRTPMKALLPLVPLGEEEPLTKANSVTFELLSNPADPASAKYKMQARVLNGDEDLRTMINWRKSALAVILGLNINTRAPMMGIMRTVLKGTALSYFEASMVAQAATARQAARDAAADPAARAAVDAQDETDFQNVAMIRIAGQSVITNCTPRKCLARIKRYLRRECRKPFDMTVRVYAQHLHRINHEELPRCPPNFQEAQKLSDDELLDILLFGTPKSWQRDMEKQQFDPLEHTMTDVVEYMEGLEAAEQWDPVKNNDKKPAAKKTGKSSATNNGSKNCMLHGRGNHTTEECKTLQREAKKLKDRNEGSTDSKPSGGYGNKTWNRKASDAKKQTKSDLAAFVQKEIAKGVKKAAKAELKAFEKKRKSDDSDDEDGEVHAFDLSDFNYQDMENLKIDDEISV